MCLFYIKKIEILKKLYRISQSFIYECLQEPECWEYFHYMVQHQLDKKGLLTEINKRDDVLVNTFKSSNQSNPSLPNEINKNRLMIDVIR